MTTEEKNRAVITREKFSDVILQRAKKYMGLKMSNHYKHEYEVDSIILYLHKKNDVNHIYIYSDKEIIDDIERYYEKLRLYQNKHEDAYSFMKSVGEIIWDGDDTVEFLDYLSNEDICVRITSNVVRLCLDDEMCILPDKDKILYIKDEFIDSIPIDPTFEKILNYLEGLLSILKNSYITKILDVINYQLFDDILINPSYEYHVNADGKERVFIIAPVLRVFPYFYRELVKSWYKSLKFNSVLVEDEVKRMVDYYNYLVDELILNYFILKLPKTKKQLRKKYETLKKTGEGLDILVQRTFTQKHGYISDSKNIKEVFRRRL